ncbi:tripartite tricarboxylate transporter substrate binding protein [Roseomonas alkaliterrae]|uniref:Tripartite-type tricarboxylate transporter receptor subunit TctC n=1 Tax=Neoroseomonas alkaliterrae TaxID=1452450 RepID=A0A840XWZ8_9PROT|nr:tripartite tricarboxylate transporter substrate binding protein [Neoroseomonas alkaliterrae]MBB5688687.1 tripartite-type tricarboxylate transporter receptor subunit TctC [Neoroseomonas alkaliterrae]MBR0675238.1 tripartite tricarboxylate transporter substrate binding protein [Neoroseomonas alkaliterrae]
MKRRVLLGAAAAAAAFPAAAQETYPARPVSIIVAFPPGGQADVVGRPVAAALERIWRVAVPIVNRGGAAGAVGNAFVARAAPDGYTLLMALSSMALLPEAARVNGREPNYTPEMLTPICLFSADPVVLVVPSASPIQTIEQFIAEIRARPGQFAYSSAGNYSALHVPMAQLAQAAGLDMLHVPFQGGGPALQAILGGQVQCLASGPGPVAPHIRNGTLRPLATWGRNRLAAFPDVPTLIEKGYPDCEFYIWVGLFAPAGTPAPILERIRAAAAQAAQDPDFQRAMTASGNTVDHRDGEAFLRFYTEDAARLVRVVRALGRIE